MFHHRPFSFSLFFSRSHLHAIAAQRRYPFPIRSFQEKREMFESQEKVLLVFWSIFHLLRATRDWADQLIIENIGHEIELSACHSSSTFFLFSHFFSWNMQVDLPHPRLQITHRKASRFTSISLPHTADFHSWIEWMSEANEAHFRVD